MIQNSTTTQRRNNYTDHLGSSSWITDADGRAIQYLDYLPFGEPWVKERAVYSSWETPYTFSGKERDEETGYSYFGARYYDSDLSIWLSVDPMASKFPYQSPYVYCGNNPLRIIDPDGRDEYEFDGQGNHIRTITNKEVDRIHIVDGDGNRTATSKDFAIGTITNQFSASAKDNDGNTVNMDFLAIKGDENSKDAFEFVAKNTDVEWSQTFVGKESGTNGESFLSNSHSKDSEGGGDYLLKTGYTIRAHNHSHPYEPNPSDADYSFAISLGAKFDPNIPTQIYHKGQYHSYNLATREVNAAIRKALPEFLRTLK